MSPLAGKPPFATDEPDSFYESSPSPQRRIRQPAPADPNKRTSAYDVYDNYLGAPDASNANNRQSGVGALGMGLLNMGDDSDDDSDEEDSRRPLPPAATAPASKHIALAAATAAPAARPGPPSPQTIAAPQPGYAAPISALNLARPEPAASRAPPPAHINLPSPIQNPFDPSSSPHARNPFNPSSTPSPTPSSATAPHPLHPPITPITPVFARPAKVGVTFSESTAVATPRKPIMRGNSEETLLPGRGEKGDDFWRRFSMVAKEESSKPPAQKESTWLRKTRSGTTRLSRWVYIIGFILLLCIGGAVGIGLYFSRNNPSHQQPTALGGSANEAATGSSSAVSASSTGTKVASSSALKVTPTHTVARREQEDEGAQPTQYARSTKKKHRHRELLERTF